VEGVAAFSIIATDLVGNVASAVTATSESSSVTVDKTLPSLTTVAIASNNTDTARAKLANTVTLSFTSNETIQAPSVTLLGVTATVANPSGNNWTATATVGAGTVEGVAAFSIIATDLVGNAANAVTTTTDSSTVTVDKTLSSLTSVTIVSNNSSITHAKLLDTVTLSFTASEAIQIPTVTLLGVAATVANPSGNKWTATATIVEGTVEGSVAFSISSSDLAGNATSVVTATTDSSSVTVDKTLPTLTTVTIASDNANTARAKLADTVTLSFTSNEMIQTPSVTLLGVAATVANPSGNNWTATVTVDADTSEGVAAFSISFRDLASNAALDVTTTTDASSVTVDKTGPTLTLPLDIAVETNNLNGVAVNFMITATDALDPAPAVSATPTSGSVFPIGTTTVNVTATDAAGNSSPGSFKVTVTRITPEIVVQDSNGNNLMSGSSTVDFGASGGGGSVSKTFTVRNTGTYQLTGLGITIDNTADFAVTAPPATPVLPGESTTFTVKFQPGTLGTTSTVLHLASNDDDEPSFEFALVGRSHALSFNGSSLTQREDAVTIKVPVQLSSAFGAAFSVPFTVGGTAAIADYTIVTPSPVKFTATQTVAYISITIKDDLIEEGDDTLILTLGPPTSTGVTVVSPSVFTLTITEDDVMPVIAPLLVSQIVAAGDAVSFPSGATGSAPLALVWKKNGVIISGETTGSYGFARATLTDGAAYSITATNQRGNASSTAQLAVVDRSDAIIRANAGSSPTLTVNATGNTLTYRWRDASGNDLPTTGTKYAGVTTKTLTVKNAVSGDTGRYTCRITAPGGSMLSGDRHLQVPSLKPITDTPAFADVVAYNSFSYQLTFDPDAARAPTKYVCSGLPAGLTCNATTGLISGTPTQTGDFTVLVTLSNSAGAADTVQDTFSVFKYPAGAVGVYAGVMGRDTKANSNLGGRIDLTTTITGGYTGTLRLGATAYPLNGTLRTAPAAGAHPGVTVNIARTGKLPVVLVLDIDPATNDLTGTVSEQGSSTHAMIVGWRNVWHTTATPTANPVVGQLGAHSFKIDPATTGPQGYGYGTVNVTNTGGTTVGGRTADGEVIATTGVLGPDGEVLVYSMLYISKGSILGTMGIESDANHSIASTLDWQKTQATTARDYAPFGPLNVAVLGGKYSVTTPLLQLPSLSLTVTDNAQFTFSDAGLPSATNPNMNLRISNTNVLTLNPTNPGKINSLVFTPTTGAFGGKMILTDPPALPRTVAFQGWLVPTLGKGYGYFLLPQLANPLATPPTTATTSPILSGKVLLEAVTR
jgi:hypothetical protein